MVSVVRQRLHSAAIRLRSAWLQILQTAVAACLAWFLAVLILGVDRPTFAPIAAVISLGAGGGRARPARGRAEARGGLRGRPRRPTRIRSRRRGCAGRSGGGAGDGSGGVPGRGRCRREGDRQFGANHYDHLPPLAGRNRDRTLSGGTYRS